MTKLKQDAHSFQDDDLKAGRTLLSTTTFNGAFFIQMTTQSGVR